MTEPVEPLREWDRKQDRWIVRFYLILTLIYLGLLSIDIVGGNWLGVINNVCLGFATGTFIFVRRIWVRMGYRHGRSVTLDHALNAVRAGVPFDVFYAAESLMIWTENDMHDHSRRADAPVPMDDAE